jgi:hypothetical protein
MTKSGRLRWVGHMAYTRENRNGAYGIYKGEQKCMGYPEGKQTLGNPGQRWECNIKMHLKKYHGREWNN